MSSLKLVYRPNCSAFRLLDTFAPVSYIRMIIDRKLKYPQIKQIKKNKGDYNFKK
jgi:hypothetical protein